PVGEGTVSTWWTKRPVAAAALAVVLLAGVGLSVFRYWNRPAPSPNTVGANRSVALLIVPFRNASGDASLDGLGLMLANILRTEVGQSANVRTVPEDRVQQIITD